MWYEKWTAVMLSIGLRPTEADPCLFTGAAEGTGRVLIGLYVDDALLFGGTSDLQRIVALVQAEFEIKDLGQLKPGETHKFLGIEIERRGGDQLCIVMKQEAYAQSVLRRFNMTGCAPVSTPMTPGTQLTHEGADLPEDNDYASIVGSLLYLAVKTRPDIAHAVGVLSRFMTCAKVPHLKAAKNVLRYLAQDPGAGIMFLGRRFTDRPRHLHVQVYTDADFAGDPIMRKSTSALLCMANKAPIIWRSKLQTIVAQSTTEAEFVAAATAVKEILWLHKLMHALNLPRSTINLLCDNMSALKLMKTAGGRVTGRCKHIAVQYWFLVDHVLKGDVTPKFVESGAMLADGLTKPYSGPVTKVSVARIGMCTGKKVD
jgi:Reverse transcriptase (RNA-dependent DNA polymerase)